MFGCYLLMLLYFDGHPVNVPAVRCTNILQVQPGSRYTSGTSRRYMYI